MWLGLAEHICFEHIKAKQLSPRPSCQSITTTFRYSRCQCHDLLLRYFHHFSYFSRRKLLTMRQKHLDDNYVQQRIRSKSTIFYKNIGNQTTANHIGSSLGNRSITRHWELWLEVTEGWRNSRRNNNCFLICFIKIGWKLKASSRNTSIGRGRPLLHGSGLIGFN